MHRTQNRTKTETHNLTKNIQFMYSFISIYSRITGICAAGTISTRSEGTQFAFLHYKSLKNLMAKLKTSFQQAPKRPKKDLTMNIQFQLLLLLTIWTSP